MYIILVIEVCTLQIIIIIIIIINFGLKLNISIPGANDTARKGSLPAQTLPIAIKLLPCTILLTLDFVSHLAKRKICSCR